ncbi:MAG TPA: ABC transporter permease [Gammaproteobacteria bacterium]|nr:ABC transporter permease [Gammaproteobacteria bacterium]
MKVAFILSSLGRDLRYALRGLARRPAFTFAAVLTLALGIGATTAIFSVVYSVLIKPLPYPNADELVSIRFRATSANNEDLKSSHTMYVTFRDENRTFANIGLWQYADNFATLTEPGEPTRLNVLTVTDGTLQALGVQPVRGRWFAKEEYGPAAEGPAPVILSYAFWQRQFGGDDAILGREISISTGPEPARVVGIMPREFRFMDATQPDVIFPVRHLEANDKTLSGCYCYRMLGRLKPGATPDEARGDADRMLSIWLNAWPVARGDTKEKYTDWRITPAVRPLKDDLVGSIASTLWVLMGAIGAVLLVACANIANLMLVRADARRDELAMRVALGAGRARIARELLVESLALGIAGGVLGWMLANVGLQVLVAMAPRDLPRLEEIAVYPPVLAFTVAVSLASTLLFGSITAVRHALHLENPKLGGARGSSTSRERSKTRSILVVVQVALALALVVSAGLMIRTFQALSNVDPGFSDPATIQTAWIWMPGWPNGDRAESLRWTRMQREIQDEIAALSGVTSVGFTEMLPLRGGNYFGAEVEGVPGSAASRESKRISPGYLKAMGARIIAGRDITWRDIDNGGRVVVISESFAREIAAEPAAAVGKRIISGLGSRQSREVVGVVQSLYEDGLYEEPPPLVYYPTLLENRSASGYVTFAIRSERAGTASFAEEVRQTIHSVSGGIAISEMRTMRQLYAESLARTSFTLVLLAIAGAMALALGVIGIYGVIAYVVSQRTREIGIRSALGAEPRQLARMILLHGLVLSGAGIAVGLAAAAALGSSMSSLVFHVAPLDPAAYIVAVGVIVGAAALASYLPARRAATIDPIETLKAE